MSGDRYGVGPGDPTEAVTRNWGGVEEDRGNQNKKDRGDQRKSAAASSAVSLRPSGPLLAACLSVRGSAHLIGDCM
jgi:hypothetical protein